MFTVATGLHPQPVLKPHPVSHPQISPQPYVATFVSASRLTAEEVRARRANTKTLENIFYES